MNATASKTGRDRTEVIGDFTVAYLPSEPGDALPWVVYETSDGPDVCDNACSTRRQAVRYAEERMVERMQDAIADRIGRVKDRATLEAILALMGR